MEYRNEILDQLRNFYQEKGPNNYVLAHTLHAFRVGDEKFLLALNQLIAEKLILGVATPDSQVAVTLNPERLVATAPHVQNNVTINIAPGASFTGPVAVGQTVSLSYTSATTAADDELREQLQGLVLSVGKVIEALQTQPEKSEIAEQLSVFVEQAKKETPSRRLLKVTGDGLIEAAKAVLSLAEPVASAVTAILSLVK
jgi:hypothetical protein